MGLDPRIGKHYLRAGLGFGGSCLPKDTFALAKFIEKIGVDPALIEAVRSINETQAYEIIDLLKRAGIDIKNSNICVLGLAFKKNTSDIRESPAIKLVSLLKRLGAKIRVHDPDELARYSAMRYFMHNKLNIQVCEDVFKCAKGADAVIIATDWEDYKSITKLGESSNVCKILNKPILIDARLIINPDEAHNAGCRYYAIGYNESQN